MTEEYVLKHKELPVMYFNIDTDRFVISEIKNIVDKKRLPFVLKESDNMTICADLMGRWIEYRGISESRRDYEEKLIKYNAKNGRELSVNSFGLNLTDQYWLHKTKHDLKWKDYNFFNNGFKRLVEKRIYPSEKKDESDNIHPDFSVDGGIIKEWLYDGKDRILVKEGKSKYNQEPFNEVIASKIMKYLGITHVDYSLKRIKKNAVSICKCMVNENTELLYARNVFDLNENKELDRYKQYIDICEKNGLKEIYKDLDNMIIIDYLIGNTDRHPRNFGIIRNADNLEWIKAAPIYDNGNSLFYSEDIKKINNNNIDSFCKWTSISNKNNLDNIKYPEWYNESKIKDILNIINNGLKYNDLLSIERISKITDIIETRIKELNKILSKKVGNKVRINNNTKKHKNKY
jgi:hypothetical protein